VERLSIFLQRHCGILKRRPERDLKTEGNRLFEAKGFKKEMRAANKQAMISLAAAVLKQLNRYYRDAKISERKTPRQIISYFAVDLTLGKRREIGAFTING
jgi:hypothetical protein